MENLSFELTPGMLALVPIVAGIIQMIKKFLAIPQIPVEMSPFIKELLPFVSIGITFGLMSYQQITDPLLPAIIIGLTAAGGFDLMKSAGVSKPKL